MAQLKRDRKREREREDNIKTKKGNIIEENKTLTITVALNFRAQVKAPMNID